MRALERPQAERAGPVVACYGGGRRRMMKTKKTLAIKSGVRAGGEMAMSTIGNLR